MKTIKSTSIKQARETGEKNKKTYKEVLEIVRKVQAYLEKSEYKRRETIFELKESGCVL